MLINIKKHMNYIPALKVGQSIARLIYINKIEITKNTLKN